MSDSRPKIKRLVFVLAALLLLSYGLFEARRYLTGPVIVIDSPKEGQTVDGPAVRVTGHAKNISYLYINGARAYVDERGTLLWVYTPPKGYTVLTARAEDRFGRAREVSISFNVR